jgi:uncharacterized protein
MLGDNASHSQGYLLANLVHFGRLLRSAGIQVSSAQISDLARGLVHIDLSQREDVFYTMRSFLVNDPEKLDAFKRIFDLYWSGKIDLMFDLTTTGMAAGQPSEVFPDSDQSILKREYQSRQMVGDDTPQKGDETSVLGAYSPVELLHRKDFAEFDAADLELAKSIIRNLVWSLEKRLTRRKVRAAKRADQIDLRRTIQYSVKQGGEITRFAWRRRKLKPRPLVIISDISGSMERYSRLFLHFMYALVQENRKVETYVFGTRLTCITPALRQSQVEAVIDRMSDLVYDWSGGTRIGEAIKTFNYRYLRRATGHGADVIIISDGWDRGDIHLLEQEIARLKRNANRLIWLNPLAGNPDYQPLARGMQAVLPYVDEFLPIHNLESMFALAASVGTLGKKRPNRFV